MEMGARKYGERNWEKGQPLSWYLDAAMRHLNQWLEGARYVPGPTEDGDDHLAQAAWNLDALVHTEELVRNGQLPKELNDLPTPKIEQPPLAKENPVQGATRPRSHYAVYICGPISDGGNLLSECGQKENVDAVLVEAAKLVDSGYAVFVPHLTWHWDKTLYCSRHWREWLMYDFQWLKKCDAVYFPNLGRGPSSGSQLEVRVACALGIPVYFDRSGLSHNFPPAPWPTYDTDKEFADETVRVCKEQSEVLR